MSPPDKIVKEFPRQSYLQLLRLEMRRLRR
jgi:hypothetical protein